jgi:pimeloyl-ACP methyl ester carboxylesterase
MALGMPLLAHQETGSGPPLVLIHGLAGSGHWWSRNIPALARNFRVYTVDLAGFGASRGRGRFHLDDAVPRLLAWLDATGIKQTSLVGHSMGGLIAVMLAADAPAQIDRLVLVDAAFLTFNPGLRRRAIGFARSVRWTALDLIPLLASDALRSGPFSLASATHQLLIADAREALTRISAPTLVIWGEHDTIVPRSVANEIVARVPNARLVLIRGAGHNSMWDRPEAFNREVLDFLPAELNEGEDRTSRSGDDPADANR